jgi:hypothetical protein
VVDGAYLAGTRRQDEHGQLEEEQNARISGLEVFDRRGIPLSQGQAVQLLTPCSIQPTCRLPSRLVLSGLVR